MIRKKRPKIHESSEIVVGARFGRLTVIGFTRNIKNKKVVLCKCDCGKDVHTTVYGLCHGQESCSCKQYEDNKIRAYKHGMGGNWKGGSNSRFYTIYYNMRARTSGKPLREKDKGYEGIKCLWNSFEEFKNDMYESYVNHVNEFGEKNTTIDRIDPNGNYCKENCRWATRIEQANNRTNNVFIEYKGERMSLSDFCRKYNINYKVARNRYYKGFNIFEVLCRLQDNNEERGVDGYNA